MVIGWMIFQDTLSAAMHRLSRGLRLCLLLGFDRLHLGINRVAHGLGTTPKYLRVLRASVLYLRLILLMW
jgi:hypothetical protein